MTILIAYLYVAATACGLVIAVGIINWLLDQYQAHWWQQIQRPPRRQILTAAALGKEQER
jgi:hypothetical protein